MSPIAQIPFGPGLDKESGSMVVQPNRMLDLRNVYHHEGSLVVREGVEKTVDFYDFTSGDPATHILMGIAIRSERAGIVVSFEQNSRRVTVHKVDALGTVATALGHWEHRAGVTAWPGTEIPKVILAEVKGTVYMAHDDQFVARRADTFVYDPTFELGQLEALMGLLEEPHDLSAEEVHAHAESSPIRFRGVVRHLDYLFGWGWGNNGPEGIRPEMVRASLPGEPRRFDPEHYFIAGDRFDPVIACAPAQKTLLVAKETETHQIVGHSRKTFGIFPYDPLFGCLAGRLMVNVSGQVYSWSAEGPMVGDDRGPWQKAWTPLDLGGFEPSTLVERIAYSEGWADYIDEVEIVIFCFGRRAYCLSRRNPADQRWTYWELARKPFCGFRLYGSFAASGVAGEGTVDSLAVEHSSTCGPSRIAVTVANSGQSGEEFIEAWYRIMGPRFADSPNRVTDGFDEDADSDGVADNWTGVDNTNSGTDAIFSLTTTPGGAAARIQVPVDVGISGGENAELRWRDNSVAAGTEYRAECELRTVSARNYEDVGTITNESYLAVEYYDAGDVLLASPAAVRWQGHEFTKVAVVSHAAPANTAYAEVVLRVTQSAIGSGDSYFRNVRFFEDGGASNWLKAPIGSPGVPVSPDATQDLPAFQVDEPGTTIEVAVRYVNAAGVPDATASDSDPTNWPAGSNSSIVMDMKAPVILRWEEGYSAELGPYIDIICGCNDGGNEGTPRYPNRDIEVQKDGAAFFVIPREVLHGWPTPAPDRLRRYLCGAAGISTVDLETNQWRARYLGPQVDSPLGPPISIWPGPYDFARPLIFNLQSTATDQYEYDVQRVQTVTPDGFQHDDFFVVGLELEDDAPAGAGTFVRRFGSSSGAVTPDPLPFTHTEAGAGGNTITVRARQIYHPCADASFNYAIGFFNPVYGPWQTATVAVTA